MPFQARTGEDGRRDLDFDGLRSVYIQGICGSAMAGVAKLLTEMGKGVTGSDRTFLSPMKEMLEGLGIAGKQGYGPENLDPAPDLVVVGNVMSRTHPESAALRERGIPYCSFPELFEQTLLAECTSIVVAGTHGKTTTTTLLAHALEALVEGPGFMAGGVAKGFGATARLGSGRWFVTEGDEYETAWFDKGPKFLHYRPQGAILTSMEYDHADIFASFDDYRRAFERFLALVPADGLLAFSADDLDPAFVRSHCRGRLVPYGLGPGAGVRAEGEVERTPEGSRFGVRCGEAAVELAVPLWGEHNRKNALGVLALLAGLGFNSGDAARAIASYPGVRRRGDVLFRSEGLWVVDDFAHHPTAVRTTLEGLRSHFGGFHITAVFDPRTNTSRTRVFQDRYAQSFGAADRVLVLPPPAGRPGEAPFSPEALASALAASGIEARAVAGADEALEAVRILPQRPALVVTLSNGGMGGLPGKLAALAPSMA
jgi:UDP-N-acetylmuramate: L-alanyl-gamma-D-glutamyl-meso-diaminopimelate ligase